jgi:CheY-like chemotaxis protein
MTEKMNILVVDDKPENIEAAKILLGNDHNLRLAKDYYQAIEQLQNGKLDALLTDMMFPLGSPGIYNPPTEDNYEERPLGYAVALYASRPHIAVPRIALLTDLNHHSNAIGATFDEFVSEANYGADPSEFGYQLVGNSRPVFNVNNSRFVMFDKRDVGPAYVMDGKLVPTNEVYDERGHKRLDGVKKVKNWREVLDTLLSEPLTLEQRIKSMKNS